MAREKNNTTTSVFSFSSTSTIINSLALKIGVDALQTYGEIVFTVHYFLLSCGRKFADRAVNVCLRHRSKNLPRVEEWRR